MMPSTARTVDMQSCSHLGLQKGSSSKLVPGPSHLLASIPSDKDNAIENGGSSPLEIVAVGIWMALLSSFLLLNNFSGPWPSTLPTLFPDAVWLFIHAVTGMLFSGGIILTTLIEWLVVGEALRRDSKQGVQSILQFWFGKVPTLDICVVLPALTAAIFSGTGLACLRYGSLDQAPIHVKASLHALVTFAIWWGSTDLTTQLPAQSALMKMNDDDTSLPRVLSLRRLSNLVSCAFVVDLYGLMILKPGLGP